MSGNSSFDIGSAIVNSLTLSINNFSGKFTDYIWDDARVVCYIGMQTSAGIEKIRICTMTVTNAPYQSTAIINLTCEDYMRKFDRDYSDSKLTYPATRLQIVQDACEVCGVTLQTTSFDNSDFVIKERPDDSSLTFRQVIAWVAQMGCQWAKCDAYGRLCLGWYEKTISKTEPDITAKETQGFTPWLYDITITGIQVTEYVKSSSEKEAETVAAGSEGYVIEISDNKLIQEGSAKEICGIISNRCVGMKFRPFNTGALTNIAWEAGDSIVISDRNGKTYQSYITTLTLNPGSFEQLECGAQSVSRQNQKQYSLTEQVKSETKKDIKDERTAREKALKDLADRLGESSGVFTTIVEQEDGSNIYYLHNKPKLEDSDMVWKMTAEAWAVSTDGGKTWNGGMTVDGDVIARILAAEGINADWINSGALTVKDADKNVIFSVNMNTNSVYMNPDYLIIGDVSLSKKLKSMEESIVSAKNMTMQLTNEYQSVSTDAGGNIEEPFSTVKTTAQVMYGSQDITSDCIYTITTSENVTGTWDNETHTYTVTSLTADNVWIDIKATYLQVLSITKRFVVAKLKAGADGTPGRTYFVESSCTVLKRGADKAIIPNFLEFSAYYRDGDSAVRYPYKGRFVVEETVDGNKWETIYTSSVDESSVKHFLYTILTDGDNQTVTDENGTTVGIPRDVTNIRCKLYTPGGTTTLMDMQSVAVAIDVDALTQEQIVNIMSNNGAWKGLYYKNGQLYISFSAALGGELALGGANNGNGILTVYDESGNISYKLTSNGNMFYNETGQCTAAIVDGKMLFPDTPFTVTTGQWSSTQKGFIYGSKGMNRFNGRVYGNTDGTIKFEYTTESFSGFYEPIFAKNGEIYGFFGTLRASNELLVGEISGMPDMDNDTAVRINIRSAMSVWSTLKLHKLSHVSSGEHLVLANDGATVAYLSSSSERYKDVQEDLQCMKQWYNIQPVWAKYKGGYLVEEDAFNGKDMPMFLAEDVKKHMPEATVYNKDGEIEDWNYRVMIPAMFAMLKQQKSEIDELKQELKEIKNLIGKE